MADCELPSGLYETETLTDEKGPYILQFSIIRTPKDIGEKQPNEPCKAIEMIRSGNFGLTGTRVCKRCNMIVTIIAARFSSTKKE